MRISRRSSLAWLGTAVRPAGRPTSTGMEIRARTRTLKRTSGFWPGAAVEPGDHPARTRDRPGEVRAPLGPRGLGSAVDLGGARSKEVSMHTHSASSRFVVAVALGFTGSALAQSVNIRFG